MRTQEATALLALGNLAGNSDNAAVDTSAGHIELLVALLSGSSAKAQEEATFTLRKKAAAATLGHLARNADNQVAIARAGAIGPLVALLSDGGGAGAQEAAAVAPGNRATGAGSRGARAWAGAA